MTGPSHITQGHRSFLRQAHLNNWQRYLASLGRAQPTSALPPARSWDLCILTASDEGQADMVRRQLAWRREAGLLPVNTDFHVVPDPEGRRIGSGGATLRILARLFRPELLPPLTRENPANLRVLVIHSGGDSRRLPHCSATGKLFARVPRQLPDGRASTIFDEFLINLSGVASSAPPGILLVSGDVLLLFDHLQLSLQRRGVLGVSVAASLSVGTRHGVYVADAQPHGNTAAVRAFLHKPSPEQLRQAGAVAPDGQVQVDTGLVWMDAATARRFADLTSQEPVARLCRLTKTATDSHGPLPPLNLYGDLLLPLARETHLEAYLADESDGPATPGLQAARRTIWQELRGTPFSAVRLQPAVFVHFGTSEEYWRMVAADPDLAHTCGWTSQAMAWPQEPGPAGEPPEGGSLFLINAVVEGPIAGAADAQGPALVVDSHLAGPVTLAGPGIVAGLHTARPLQLPPGLVLHQLPVDGGVVTRLFGLYDDPKRPWDDPAATFLNRPWAAWLAGLDLPPEVIWPGISPEARTLWNARLYPRTGDREESLWLTLGLLEAIASATPDPAWRARWEAQPRLSLAESFVQADGQRILDEMAAVEDRVMAHRTFAAMAAERPASEIAQLFHSGGEARPGRRRLLERWLAEADPLLQMRGYKALAVATGEGHWEDRAFGVLAGLIQDDVRGHRRPGRPPVPATGHGHAVRVAAAARIDFGGGWTDTPPYSIERGGTVLNGAITLHGAHPIVAEAAWLPEPRLVLESRDIGESVVLEAAGEALDYANPADPFALLKAALVLKGLVPEDASPQMPLAELLRETGGVRLSTQTHIPRGSGLGTSSIMAGALLASLDRLLGQESNQSRLFDEVLCLEQMLTTGGGWQDQVGGLVGGIKLVHTAPGLPQRITVDPVALPPAVQEQLGQCLCLVYTGQQRLAKNLLRAVMGRWMARDPEMVWILEEIGRLAVAMRDALAAGDLGQFGALLAEHWALNKRMDPGCTNPFIDELFERMTPYIHGGKLAGAGGGGFALVLARDGQAARELAAMLMERYQGTPVGLWPCAIAAQGLVCSVP
ncbi:hypothetical protein FKZ61_022070 [Litorilinea aerophila]|uniref:Bifunctional fucokinase/L-fucose-1-P-guanylyltransferase n=1 Tax=Litorilinea aerophila TaxID=1204385 RepID=A0A540V946_9CHLR|nr:L-fucokinase [Litorilinea aerophila]MCC9078785.1 hypothetical protein [Litorilinea aerophila]